MDITKLISVLLQTSDGMPTGFTLYIYINITKNINIYIYDEKYIYVSYIYKMGVFYKNFCYFGMSYYKASNINSFRRNKNLK